MDLGIEGRRALVFGGSRGVGRAVAGTLAAEGADVAVCARKEWAAKKVASEAAENSGVKAKGYRIDAWDEQSTIALVNGIMDDFGAIDIMFGIARRSALEERNVLSTSDWHTQFDTGFLRFKAVTETILPGMRDRQWGRILWMIPWPAVGTRIERQTYFVMTAALSAWIESVATEFAEDNVAVNMLKPTPMSRAAGSNASYGHGKSQRSSVHVPANKILSVHDVAAAAAFLLGNLAGGIHGSTIVLGLDGAGYFNKIG